MQERANRKHRRILACGLRQAPGTHPKKYEPTGEPVFRPMPSPIYDFSGVLAGLSLLFTPWWRRRQKRELAEEAEKKLKQ
jgi:hypothetical protein